MNNTTVALYRVSNVGKHNEMRYSQAKSVLRHRQFKKPCLQAAPEWHKW